MSSAIRGDLSSMNNHRLNNKLETETDDINELKDAIIELYLAIKIRSTEEVSTQPKLFMAFQSLMNTIFLFSLM